jgi:hypothetical protein
MGESQRKSWQNGIGLSGSLPESYPELRGQNRWPMEERRGDTAYTDRNGHDSEARQRHG